jgi:glycosyltransferase involved in cell wall biosynthesis
MPFRNAERWIEETINSIILQSRVDWELIAIDDFSTDASLKLVKEFSNKDERIRIYNNTSRGIIPALQLALKHAKGIYVTRMDADDIMPKDRLELMLTTLQNTTRNTVVTGKVAYFSDTQVSQGYKKYESWLNERVTAQDHFDHLYRECVIASPNWLVRKIDLIEAEIFERLEYPEDYDMVFRFRENDFKIEGINETTLLWREHPDRISRNSAVYDQQSFFKLKLKWFLKLNELKNEKIGIMGAGKKGKIVAKFFLDNGIDFDWYDQNYKRFNNPVLGKHILDQENIKCTLLIVAVFPERMKNLLLYLDEKDFVIGRNAWFF